MTAPIASGGGRMLITMDRYEADWAMVERGWRCHVLGEGRRFATATEAIRTLYAEDMDHAIELRQLMERPTFVPSIKVGQPAGTGNNGNAVKGTVEA